MNWMANSADSIFDNILICFFGNNVASTSVCIYNLAWIITRSQNCAGEKNGY